MANPEGSPFNTGVCNQYGRNVDEPKKVDLDFGWPSSTPESTEATAVTTPVPQEQTAQSQ